MNKEFIPYEQALALKELGFDEPCFSVFRNNEFHLMANIDAVNTLTNGQNSEMLKAPLYQQAFNFFREKYNLHAEINWEPSYEYEPGEWSDAIYGITIVNVSYTKEWKAQSPNFQKGNGRQLTFESTQLECLKELIKIVKTS